jgi:hypothetical protein
MDDPLAILHALWNSDKHRTLVLSTGWAKMDAIDVTYNGVFSDFYWSKPIVDNGSEVLRCPGGLHSKEHLETFLQIEVSLKEGVVTDCPITPMRPIEEVATSMYQVVESIVRDIGQGEYTIWLGELPPSGWDRWERYIRHGDEGPLITGGLTPLK